MREFFQDKRRNIFALLFSTLISFLQVIGYNSAHFDSAKLNNLTTYLWILLFIPIIFFITTFIWSRKITSYKKSKLSTFLFEKKYSFLLLTLLIVIAWIPVLITFYPGNFGYDAGTQMRMLKFHCITKYHPVLHTMFLAGTILLGKNITTSWNIGILIHSILQMIIMASIFSYTIIYLHKKKIPNYFLYIFTLLYMFLPTHSVFSITTTKDILFSGFFNIVLILFLELSENPKKNCTKKNTILIILFTFLLIAFRNNMLYAFVVFIPFFLWFHKKYFKKILLLLSTILVITFAYDKTLTYVFHIENGPRVEMFSFVVQQFARTYHKDSLTKKEKEKIEQLYLNNSLENYHPHISDPVKSNFNTEVLLNNKKEYLSLYLNLWKKNPNTFIDSIFNNIYSFYYLFDKLPDEGAKSYIEISCLTDANNTIDKTYSCGKENTLYYKLVMDAKYQKIPLLDILMNMAFYFIIILFVSFYLLYKKNYKLFLPLLLLLLYMGTNLLAPVAIVRYAYPLFTTFPILIGIYLETKKGH